MRPLITLVDSAALLCNLAISIADESYAPSRPARRVNHGEAYSNRTDSLLFRFLLTLLV